MTESLPGYDEWKTTDPPEWLQASALDLVARMIACSVAETGADDADT